MSGPTREALSSLYSSTLKTAQSFASYNFRAYFVQRTNHVFRAAQAEQDLGKVNVFIEEKQKELEVLKRAALINQMYGGRKLVVETGQDVPTPERIERGDN